MGGLISKQTVHEVTLVIVGDPGVGKSCLLSRYVKGNYDYGAIFPGDFRTAVAENYTVDLDGERVQLSIWDTTGKESMRPLLRRTYEHADGIIVAYDCTSLQSFNGVKQWVDEIDHYGPDRLRKLLVGTKCDLYNKKVVDYETAKEYAGQLKIPFFETSAKNTRNVEQAFETLVKQIMNYKLDSTSVYLPMEISDSISPAPGLNNENKTRSVIDKDDVTNLDDLWRKMKKHLDEGETRSQNKFDKLAEESTRQHKEVLSRIDSIGNKFEENLNS